MISILKTGNTKKRDQTTFCGREWQLIADNQAILSILKAIGVKNDEYRSMYILTGVDNTVVSGSGSTSLLEVWAGWHKEPYNGSLFVCLYDRGKIYKDEG